MEEGDAIAIAGRIKQFIEYLGLSITQFADMTEIQRSSMSQILAGRNQKISVITIGKIHAAYPTLSIYWLLYGEGSMLLTTAADATPTIQGVSQQTARPTTDMPRSSWSLFDDENRLNASGESNDLKYPKENGSNKASVDTDVVDNVDINSLKASFIEPNFLTQKNRKAVKIMIFYSDNTFETFSPDNLG